MGFVAAEQAVNHVSRIVEGVDFAQLFMDTIVNVTLEERRTTFQEAAMVA